MAGGERVDLDIRQPGQEQDQAGRHLQIALKLGLIAGKSRRASAKKPFGPNRSPNGRTRSGG
jgi:hypothetical protein